MTTSTVVDANMWQIMTEIQRVLRSEVQFVAAGEDRSQSIDSKAIVIRKFAFSQIKDGAAGTHETLPGILICPSRVVRPAEAGTNEQDDVVYRIILQFVDKDYDNTTHNLRTHLKWMEQAAKIMNHWFAEHQITNQNDCVRDNVATAFDMPDAREFVRHKNFIGGVVVDAFVLEQRGAT